MCNAWDTYIYQKWVTYNVVADSMDYGPKKSRWLCFIAKMYESQVHYIWSELQLNIIQILGYL